jgi:hypothetical protein
MSLLLRAPQEAACWEWELDDFAPPGLDSALMTAARMSAVLRDHRLLYPQFLEWMWTVHGHGGTGVITRLVTSGPLDEGQLSRRVRESKPVGLPDAEPGVIQVLGTGTWFDAEGKEHQESDLVVLSVYPDQLHLAAEVAVFHDIWDYCDFHGNPHPEVQRRNAPRLSAALQALEKLLDAPAVPGDATYFGKAEGYGLADPDLIDGRGPDLTDML